jgi:hypothetical protein
VPVRVQSKLNIRNAGPSFQIPRSGAFEKTKKYADEEKQSSDTAYELPTWRASSRYRQVSVLIHSSVLVPIVRHRGIERQENHTLFRACFVKVFVDDGWPRIEIQ